MRADESAAGDVRCSDHIWNPLLTQHNEGNRRRRDGAQRLGVAGDARVVVQLSPQPHVSDGLQSEHGIRDPEGLLAVEPGEGGGGAGDGRAGQTEVGVGPDELVVKLRRTQGDWIRSICGDRV